MELKVGDTVKCLKTTVFCDNTRHVANLFYYITKETLAYYLLNKDSYSLVTIVDIMFCEISPTKFRYKICYKTEGISMISDAGEFSHNYGIAHPIVWKDIVEAFTGKKYEDCQVNLWNLEYGQI